MQEKTDEKAPGLPLRSSDSPICIWVVVLFGHVSALPFSAHVPCFEFTLACITDVVTYVQVGQLWPMKWATPFAERPPDSAKPPRDGAQSDAALASQRTLAVLGHLF